MCLKMVGKGSVKLFFNENDIILNLTKCLYFHKNIWLLDCHPQIEISAQFSFFSRLISSLGLLD